MRRTIVFQWCRLSVNLAVALCIHTHALALSCNANNAVLLCFALPNTLSVAERERAIAGEGKVTDSEPLSVTGGGCCLSTSLLLCTFTHMHSLPLRTSPYIFFCVCVFCICFSFSPFFETKVIYFFLICVLSVMVSLMQLRV